MDTWVLGIDGGGTSSRIRVESLAGERLYSGSDGGTNINSSDAATVTDTLKRLVSGAIASGLDPDGCLAGFIGSAGVDLAKDRMTMAAAFGDAFRLAAETVKPGFGRNGREPVFAAGNDAEPALAGALADVEGFLLIAGTGSIAFGRSRSGDSARAGGWGHFLGDEGSAFWIAFEGIKRGIRSAEGREVPSVLIDAAVAFFGLPDSRAFIPLTYSSFDKAKIASFAPRVTELAASGDPLARAIVDQAAVELSDLVASVYDRLSQRVESKRLALYGGLLEKNQALKAAVSKRVMATIPGLAIVEPAGDAQAGACRLARQLLS